MFKNNDLNNELKQQTTMKKKPTIIIYAVAIILFIVIFTIFFLNSKAKIDFDKPMDENYRIIFSVLAIATTSILLGTSILRYLKGNENTKQLNVGLTSHRNVLRMYNELAAIKLQLKESSKLEGTRNEVVEIAKELFEKQIDDLTKQEIIEKVKSEFKNDSIQNQKFSIIEKELVIIQERIYSQTSRLIGSARLNLTIGIVTTFLVVVFLMISVITLSSDAKNYTEFIMHFLPRLSLSIILEVFAYFFLRLYTKNLEETKYWNNELTNMQMKGLALKTTLLEGNPKIVEKVVLDLLNTERNFILKKGETTVELEKLKSAEANNSNIIGSLMKLIDLKKLM